MSHTKDNAMEAACWAALELLETGDGDKAHVMRMLRVALGEPAELPAPIVDALKCVWPFPDFPSIRRAP